MHLNEFYRLVVFATENGMISHLCTHLYPSFQRKHTAPSPQTVFSVPLTCIDIYGYYAAQKHRITPIPRKYHQSMQLIEFNRLVVIIPGNEIK